MKTSIVSRNCTLFKRLRRLVFAAVLFAALFPASAFASELSVNADSTSVKSGQEVAVTVKISGASIAAAQGTFTYDPSVLTFVSGSGGAADGTLSMVSAQSGGSDSLTSVIKFVASGAGETVVDVSLDKVYDYSGAPLDPAGSAVSVTVSSSGDASSPESSTAIDVSKTGVPAENVEGANNPMYIWRSLSNLTLPGGYADRQVEYNGEFVGGAAVPDTEFPVLLYLSEADGGNAGYYIYEADRNILYPYYTLTSVRAVYTLMSPEDGAAVPEGFSEASLTIKEKELPAWTNGDGKYLVYAKNPSGEKGYYLYDAEEESMQRYVPPKKTETQPAEDVSAPAPKTDESEKSTISMTWFLIVCGICVVLFMILMYVIIMNGIRRTRRQAERRRVRRE